MTQAQYIIEKAGGITALSRMLGHRHRTTVQGWSEVGYIHMRHWGAIMKAFAARGIIITKEDFVVHLDLEECAA